jgi:hypothetical protein
MFFKKSETKPTPAQAIETFRNAISAAIRAARHGGVHWRNMADVLQRAADVERMMDATSGTPSIVKCDGFYRPIN